MNHRHRAILALIIVAAIWGIANPIIKITLQYTPPFTFLFFRLLIASLVVLPFFIRDIGHRTIERRDLWKLVLLSFFGQTIYLSLIFLGLSRTSAIEGSIIASIIPVFTVIGGVFILNETVTRLEKVGIAVILLGTAVTFTDSIQLFTSGASTNLTGNILLVVSGLSWTAFAILSKELFERYNPLPLTAFTFFIGLATFTPLMIWEQWFSTPAVTLDLIHGRTRYALHGDTFISCGITACMKRPLST